MSDSVSPNPAEGSASGAPVDWSKRQLIVGTGALAAVGVVALFAGSGVETAVRSIFGPTVQAGSFSVYQGDYFFIPNYMTWRVGDLMTMTLHNTSPTHYHEMMIGKGFDYQPSQLHDFKTQFQTDFWNGVHINVLQADGIDNYVENKAIINTNSLPAPWLIKGVGQGNTSPTLMPGGTLVIQFTVPNKPGIWHYGCFVQGYIHYLAGMRGTINILPA